MPATFMAAGQGNGLAMRMVSDDLASALFWFLAAVVLVNFHHVANMIFTGGWFVTAAVLAGSAALVALVRLPLRQVLGGHGLCMLAALASYAVIGTAVAALTDLEWQLRDPYYALRPWFAIVVIVGSALGATAALRRIGSARFLAAILVLLAITTALILASPWLIEHVYTNLSETEYYWLRGRYSRYFGTFVNPIPAGMAACSAVVLSLTTMGYLRGRYVRLIGGSVAVVGSIAVMLTLSRTAVVTLGIVLILFLFSASPHDRGRRQWTAFRVFLALLVGVLGAAILYRESLRVSYLLVDRFLGFSTQSRGGLFERMELFEHGLRISLASPLFGTGLTSIGWMEGAVGCQQTPVCGAHNSFLQFWGEAGPVPALLLALAFVLFLVNARRLSRSSATDTAVGWTLVFVIYCLFADGGPHFIWLAFVFGLSCALLAHAARNQSTAGRTNAPSRTRLQP